MIAMLLKETCGIKRKNAVLIFSIIIVFLCQVHFVVRVSQDFVENIFSVHYGRCQSLVSEPFSGIDIVSAFGLSSLIL
ncbi:hypothetical protein D9545_16790, partial [Geobacillus stearothermophilus]